MLHHNKEVCDDISIRENIFKSIDRTITDIGKKKLKHRITYCSSDVKTLDEMALKNFTVHKDRVYCDMMRKYLTELQMLESNLHEWMTFACDDKLKYDRDILNNRILLSTSNKLKMSYILVILTIYVLIYLYINYAGYEISAKEYVERMVHEYYMFIKLACMLILSNPIWIKNTAIGLTGMYMMYQFYVMYQTVNTSYEHYNQCNEFSEKYSNIIKYIDIANDICKNDIYHDTSKIIKSIDYLRYYFTNDSSLGFSLVTKIDTSDYIKHIDIIVNYIGRVDVTLSIVSLLDEEYTVPKFIKSQFPILHGDGVWTPVISKDKRVKNSLIMNVNTPNICIITGPNKAGKSTFMRCIMTAVYLAHSIGVTCADRLSLTPYRDMFTYMNVPDNIGRESLFEAELNRCYNYINNTESLRGFSFGIVDELFTGTNPTEGSAATYSVIKRLAENPTNITIISTHYNNVVDVIKQHDADNFIFNKFEAYIQDYKHVFTYKIQNGISNQHIALKLLKEKGYSDDIVNNALSFIEKYNH